MTAVAMSHHELLFQLRVRNDLIDQQAARIIELTERLNVLEGGHMNEHSKLPEIVSIPELTAHYWQEPPERVELYDQQFSGGRRTRYIREDLYAEAVQLLAYRVQANGDCAPDEEEWAKRAVALLAKAASPVSRESGKGGERQ